MRAAIYYLVRVKLIRFIKDGKIDFITEEKKFKSDNPLEAREKVLDYYNSYIDTLLEPGLAHNEVQEKLRPRIEGADNLKKEEEDYYIPPRFFNGIGVFMVVNDPMEEWHKRGYEFMIHGIGFSSGPIAFMDALNTEINYYSHFNYDKGNYVTGIRFYNGEDDEIYDETIMKTPFDWTGLDVPPNDDDEAGNEEGKEEHNQGENKALLASNQQLVEALLDKGESRVIEFKSALKAYKNGSETGFSRHIQFAVIKTIASFLNSKGGFLLVGVDDHGEVLGLDADFSLNGDSQKKSEDYFKIQVDYIIKENFKAVASKIRHVGQV